MTLFYPLQSSLIQLITINIIYYPSLITIKHQWSPLYHHYINITNILVGGIPTPLKNMSSSVGMIFHSQLNGKSFKIPWFQSPPTSYCFTHIISYYNDQPQRSAPSDSPGRPSASKGWTWVSTCEVTTECPKMSQVPVQTWKTPNPKVPEFSANQIYDLLGGWANPSEKYEIVSWDDEIP